MALSKEDSFLKTIYEALNPFALENVTDRTSPQRSANACFRQSVVAYGGTFNAKRVRFLGCSGSWFLTECSLKNSWCLSEQSASKRIHNATNNFVRMIRMHFKCTHQRLTFKTFRILFGFCNHFWRLTIVCESITYLMLRITSKQRWSLSVSRLPFSRMRAENERSI